MNETCICMTCNRLLNQTLHNFSNKINNNLNATNTTSPVSFKLGANVSSNIVILTTNGSRETHLSQVM